jgi:cytidylate kinase
MSPLQLVKLARRVTTSVIGVVCGFILGKGTISMNIASAVGFFLLVVLPLYTVTTAAVVAGFMKLEERHDHERNVRKPTTPRRQGSPR